MIPFLHITTKIPGRKHDDLLREKGFGGFPTLVFMDAEGNVLSQQIERSIEGFAAGRDRTLKLVALTERSKTDPEAAKELLLLELDMRKVGFEQAVARAESLKFAGAEQLALQTRLVETLARMQLPQARAALATLELEDAPKARAGEILVDLEIRDAMAPLMRGFPATRPGEKPVEPPYEICYELWKKGKLPSDKPRVDTLYWTGVLRVADKVEDVEAYRQAAGKLREILADNKSYLESIARRLRELEGGDKKE